MAANGVYFNSIYYWWDAKDIIGKFNSHLMSMWHWVQKHLLICSKQLEILMIGS